MNKQQLANKIWASANKMRSSVEKSYIYHKHDGKVYFAGFFFCFLDTRISLETQRLDKLKQIKSACLDKIFV